MKRLSTIAAVFCFLAAFAFDLGAVQVDENGGVWTIQTDSYELHFKVAAQAGYSQVFPSIEAGAESLFGAGQGRNFYHAANYNGWKDWGTAVDVEEVSNANSTLIMKYTLDDGDSKVYEVTATYWDGAPYFKHELVVTAKNAVMSLSDGHEPMVEPRNGKGAGNQYMEWDAPFPHVAMESDGAYFAMYTEVGTTAFNAAWNTDGRMHLLHNEQGVNLQADASSDPLVYYLAIGPGGLDNAHDLAEQVTEEPASLSVQPQNKLAARWAELKK
ncbi:MAG: hypothetical protein OXT69_07700 [Candidatus Poribacteria bacterium]|nr:hypothetical protein [Candidatus Poribacteria bacterium]